ncbi:hypothetical protein HUT03_00460 [Candidatus Liberibacter africanus]|uniref:Lipoprotein n=1 Tax=Candidatus Liberibacter africanus PTSAPSY TaxID=1277257 RepID=A0A0G3I5K6_LIBAF|nr:hypothetical protein [Candidatus Liberibacter africanus]AKK19748.1 hypothetical protein G293_00500 [Candidatus Liberibacter africanus PTSAPSY]QTP63627.1 hypothetical protein HUT03_00460 [Candidatus Liberibacter africanus]
MKFKTILIPTLIMLLSGCADKKENIEDLLNELKKQAEAYENEIENQIRKLEYDADFMVYMITLLAGRNKERAKNILNLNDEVTKNASNESDKIGTFKDLYAKHGNIVNERDKILTQVNKIMYDNAQMVPIAGFYYLMNDLQSTIDSQFEINRRETTNASKLIDDINDPQDNIDILTQSSINNMTSKLKKLKEENGDD